MKLSLFPVGKDGSGSSGVSVYNRDRTLSCPGKGWCEPIVVLHLGFLKYSKFHVEVQFDGLQNSSYPVDEVAFDVRALNTDLPKSQFDLKLSCTLL